MSDEICGQSTLALIAVRINAGDQVSFQNVREVDPDLLGRPFEVKEVTMQVRWNPDPLAAFDWRLSVQSGVRCKVTRRGRQRRATWLPWHVMKVLGTRR